MIDMEMTGALIRILTLIGIVDIQMTGTMAQILTLIETIDMEMTVATIHIPTEALDMKTLRQEVVQIMIIDKETTIIIMVAVAGNFWDDDFVLEMLACLYAPQTYFN